jgi:hypothetical protein
LKHTVNSGGRSSGVSFEDGKRENAEVETMCLSVDLLGTRMEAVEKLTGDVSWGEELRVLRTSMTEIEDQVTDSGFELDDFQFGSKAELRKFVVDEKVPSCGLSWELFSVMVVMEPKRMTSKEDANNRYSADRVSTTTLENDLAASMSQDQPALLFGMTGGQTVPTDAGLAACRSYGKWIGKGCESYKQKLGKLLKTTQLAYVVR